MCKLTRTTTSGAVLGITMALANALSYAFILILSRAFGPADFGAYSVLSSYGIVLSVPAGAFQVIVARHVSSGDSRISGLRLSLLIGTALAGVSIVASPLLREVFHLESSWSVVWLALTLIPMTLTGAFQGVLLGQERLVALSGLYISTAVGRLVAGFAAAAVGLNVAEVFALLFFVATLVAIQGAIVCRDHLVDASSGSLWNDLVRATTALGAFIALTNADVILARVFLTEVNSGGYALAATFGRAVGWGTQFIALLMVPRMQAVGRTKTLLNAHALIFVLGVACIAAIAIAPSWWMVLVGGDEYAQFASLAVACVALGVLWALVQLNLFAEMGLDGVVLSRTTWIVIAAQAVAVTFWFHETAMQIVAVSAVGAAVIVCVGLVRLRSLDRA
ncbi:MAG: hypothetical protein GX678_02255 [Actinomycetales bacterium]|nr:hypothetical protein [Actinomycetales bacterium]